MEGEEGGVVGERECGGRRENWTSGQKKDKGLEGKNG